MASADVVAAPTTAAARGYPVFVAVRVAAAGSAVVVGLFPATIILGAKFC